MTQTSNTTDRSDVIVYWRPGCPYCSRLRRGLHQVGLPVTEVNIWDNPAAAAVVRSAAVGNETVPTVIVGSTALVNPSVRSVVETVQRIDPGRLIDDKLTARVGRMPRIRIVKWGLLAAIVAASLTADRTGHFAWSWGLDGVALTLWAGFRVFSR